MPLTLLGRGQVTTVKKISGKDDIRRFLRSLGFTEGGMVSVICEVGGDLIVNVKDSRIAINKTMASRIFV